MVSPRLSLLLNKPGRVEDSTELRAKSGLREIAQYMIKSKSGHFRLTGNQHVILSGIHSQHLSAIKQILAQYKLDNLNFSGLRLSSYACLSKQANYTALHALLSQRNFELSDITDSLGVAWQWLKVNDISRLSSQN